MHARQSVHGAVEDGGDLTYFVGEGGEFFGEDGLHAVGEGFVRLMVHFDDEAIGADGNSGAGKRQNFVALAGAVAGIDENGEVAALFDGGNDREVEGIAGKIGEGANAAFAEHDVVIAFGEDVFGGHEKFVEGGRHAAFEQDGFFGAAGALEEREILHIAGADLDDVGVFLNEVEGFVVDGLGDNAEAVGSADFRKDFEALFTEALEAIGGSARLVCAAAEEPCAGFFDALGDGQALRFRFDSTGAGDEGNVIAANDDIAGRRGDAQDGIFFLGVAADEFVRFADRDAFDDTGKGFEDTKVDGVFVASDADGGANRAGDGMRFQAEAFDTLADLANLLLGGMGLHYYKHG